MPLTSQDAVRPSRGRAPAPSPCLAAPPCDRRARCAPWPASDTPAPPGRQPRWPLCTAGWLPSTRRGTPLHRLPSGMLRHRVRHPLLRGVNMTHQVTASHALHAFPTMTTRCLHCAVMPQAGIGPKGKGRRMEMRDSGKHGLRTFDSDCKAAQQPESTLHDRSACHLMVECTCSDQLEIGLTPLHKQLNALS